MQWNEDAIDHLLRRSMSAQIPNLSQDFDQRVMREVRRSSQPLDRYRRFLLTGYGAISVGVSAVLMRGQGIEWGLITATTLAPVMLIVAGRWVWRSTHVAAADRAK
jgi:hypothetical protein